MALAIVTRYALLEIFVGYVVDQLRKNSPANVHSYIVLSRKNAFLAKFFDLNFKSFPLGNTATTTIERTCGKSQSTLPDTSAFALMISGGSVSNGLTSLSVRRMSRLLITTWKRHAWIRIKS